MHDRSWVAMTSQWNILLRVLKARHYVARKKEYSVCVSWVSTPFRLGLPRIWIEMDDDKQLEYEWTTSQWSNQSLRSFRYWPWKVDSIMRWNGIRFTVVKSLLFVVLVFLNSSDVDPQFKSSALLFSSATTMIKKAHLNEGQVPLTTR